MTENTAEAARRIDYEKLRKVADLAQILDVTTAQFAASIHMPMMAPDVSSLGQRIAFRAKRLPTPPALVVSMIRFEFAVLTPEGESVAEVDGTVNVVYGLPEDAPSFSDEQLDLFAEVNGIYSAWPYIRELVSTSAARLGLSGLVLPVWRPPTELPPAGEPHVMEKVLPHSMTDEE